MYNQYIFSGPHFCIYLKRHQNKIITKLQDSPKFGQNFHNRVFPRHHSPMHWIKNYFIQVLLTHAHLIDNIKTIILLQYPTSLFYMSIKKIVHPHSFISPFILLKTVYCCDTGFMNTDNLQSMNWKLNVTFVQKVTLLEQKGYHS